MSVKQWDTTVRDIMAAVNLTNGDPDEAKSLIFGLWSAFMSAPAEVHEIFEAIDDEGFLAETENLVAQICAGIPMDAILPGDTKAMARRGAFLLRALEAIYLNSEGTRSHRSNDEFRVEYRGSKGFLLPFKPTFRKAKPWPPYFQRRGLAGSRCIPATLASGETIDLVFTDKLLPEGDLVCGAQLFEASVPLDENGNPIDFDSVGPFIFHGLATKVDPAISDRLRAACSGPDECNILVFPELMMPKNWQNELQEQLLAQSWDTELKQASPFFVLGGSWHDKRVNDEKHENCAPLYDGFGNLLGVHKKTIRYSHLPAIEDIEVSNSILVVASRELTVAIAICLDFCQTARPANPYDLLDVDLILISSMGRESTMESHEAKAKQFWDNRKTATFIAQQHDKEPFGYVASLPKPPETPFGERVLGPAAHRKINRKA
jgi:hypothetical protein